MLHKMFTNPSMHKKILRKKYLEIRNRENRQNDNNIILNLYNLTEFNNAENLFIYVSFGSEPDTLGIIKDCLVLNKKVYVPKCIPGTKTMKALRIKSLNELSKGAYGILEPDESSEVFSGAEKSLIICPGLCFTVNGDRLGYGGGYYDRFLKEYKNKIPIAALCYESLIADELTAEPTDVKTDIIITEERIIRVK